MNKTIKINKLVICILLIVFSMSMTVCAEDDDSEPTDVEQSSFCECDDGIMDTEDFDSYVDGIYNVNENARVAMSGVIRLGRSGSTLVADYSTVYTVSVDKIGVKNIKLQYKGSLGIWHDIITLDNRYRTNAAAYQGGFTCSGVIGRTYRLKGTHYIINGSYTENRNNITENLTF